MQWDRLAESRDWLVDDEPSDSRNHLPNLWARGNRDDTE
jgi:hypothetical protein